MAADSFFYGLDLGSAGVNETVTFAATTLNGTQLPGIAVTAQADGRLRTQTAAFANLNQVLRSISWNMPGQVRIDNLLAATRVEDVMNFETLPVTSSVTVYEEGGYRLTGTTGLSDVELSGSQGALGVTLSATYTLESVNGHLSRWNRPALRISRTRHPLRSLSRGRRCVVRPTSSPPALRACPASSRSISARCRM